MAIRYRTKVASEKGNTWTIHIHDTGHSGSITDFDTARPGFKLDYAGGEDIFHPIIPSTVTVPMYITDSGGDTFLSDLANSDEGRFRLTIRDGNSDTSPLWWVGVITLDNIVIEDVPFPYVVEIKAVDGLQLLSRIPYTLQSNFAVYNVILHCLSQIGTSDLFQTSGTDTYALSVIPDLTPDVATYADPFEDVKIRPAVYDALNGVYEYDTDCETILTEVARSYNSRLCLCEGTFHFLPVGKLVNTQSNLAFTQWKFDGTKTVTTGQQFVRVFSSAPVSGSADVRLSGWSTQFLPPVSSVERPLNFGEGVIISNENVGGTSLVPSGATSGTSEQAFTFTTENEVPTGATFSIRGRFECDADYIGLTSNRTGRVRVGMKLQVGSYICKRETVLHPTDSVTIQADQFNSTPTTDEDVLNWEEPDTPTWSGLGSNRVHWGTDLLNYDRPLPNFATGQDDDTTTSLDFTTPPIPAATSGDISVTFYVVGFDGDGSDMTQAKKDSTNVLLTFALVAGEGYNGNTVLYKATTSNGATEVRQEDVIHLGSQVVFSSQFLYNPAEFYNVNGGLPDWNSTLTPSASVGMHEICVRDIAQYLNKPRRIWSGSFQSYSTPYLFRMQVYDSVQARWFMAVNMSMNADSDIFDIELHELDNSGAPTSNVVKPGPGKPVPVLTSIDSISKRFERGIRNTNADLSDVIIDVNEVRAGSDGTGGLSSVLLSSLGDVKISSPLDGQLLEYNVTAGRWANVTPSSSGTDNSLSETDQTISEGTTRDIVLDGSVSNNSFLRIVDDAGGVIFSVQNYGTILNIIEYYGLIAYRSTATAPGSIAIYEPAASGTNFVQIKSPALSSNVILTLPETDGNSGDVLTSNGTGVMTWEAPATPTLPIAKISGRWTWSSADDGERVMTGSSAYGPFNWYSHQNEPSSTTIRVYDAAHVIGTTNGTMPAYYLPAFCIPIHTNTQKIRIDFQFRVQNARDGSTWGMSVWGVDEPANGSTSNVTFTLRGVSSDVTTVGTSSVAYYSGTLTTSAVFNETHLLPLFDNRTGALDNTAYIYGQFSVYLVP